MTVSSGQMSLPYPDGDPTRFTRPGPVSRYANVAAYLRAHPGEWRCIDRRPTAESARVMARNARCCGRPPVLAGMEVRVRRGFEVWACWPKTEQD